MSVQQLITEHLDVWTAAHKTRSTAARGSNNKLELVGIKKLRELILELAVRGKLVPQDANDEPASELLKKIANEKAKLIKERKIKKDKLLPKITAEEKPFQLPSGWGWARFGELYELEYGDNLPEPKRSGTGEFSVFGSNGIVGTHNECCIESPCIVVGRKGSAGALNLCLDSGCWVTDVAYSVVPPSLLDLNFVFKQFHTLGLDVLGKGIKPGLNRNEAYELIVAIPPLAEQHRIVAKVDELMAFCDQLEQVQTNDIAAHAQLVEALLATLVESTDHKELQGNWQRLAAHFDTLFATEHSIDQLKQTILQLAVMGKLVPQNPTDQPASELLKKIALEKEQLIKEGKIKKQKPLPEITKEEKPFELPEGWEWVKFGSLVNFKAELVRPEEYLDNEQVAPDLIEKGTGRLMGRRTVEESGIRGPNSRFYSGQLLYSKIRPSLSKAVIVDFDGLCSADMYPLDALIDTKFLLKLILSEIFLVQVRVAENRIKMPKLNIESLSNFVIPIAPSAEQHRIVTKVEELMTLCDTLKANLQNAQTTQLALAESLVEQAVN